MYQFKMNPKLASEYLREQLHKFNGQVYLYNMKITVQLSNWWIFHTLRKKKYRIGNVITYLTIVIPYEYVFK